MILRRVTGYSMLPTLGPGQLVLGGKPRKLKVGDIIVFEHRGLEKIKRLYALETARVQVRGDNAKHSTDSREFGWLPVDAVIARVIWPKA